jgi:4-hydroxybenzoate polyprenyltransferase
MTLIAFINFGYYPCTMPSTKVYLIQIQYNIKEVRFMGLIWTIVVILVILWLLGLLLGLAGGLIHILLVVAIIIVLIRIIQGRKPL